MTNLNIRNIECTYRTYIEIYRIYMLMQSYVVCTQPGHHIVVSRGNIAPTPDLTFIGNLRPDGIKE